MVTYNEEENIAMAIESAKHMCDRIVIVDDGSYDRTVEIAKRVCSELNFDNLIIEAKHTGKIYDTRDLALRKCKGDWIVVTDGDFIWHTSGTNDSVGLRWLATKHTGKNAHVYMPLAFLYGDYWHTLKNRPIGYPHPYLVENNPSLRCVKDKRFFKYVTKEPIVKEHSNVVYGFHAGGVKSAEMLLYRRFWTPWRELGDFKTFPTAWSYATHNVGDNIPMKAKMYFRDYMKAWMKFDTDKYGYYPEILKKKMASGKCLKLIYEGGQIVGRSDIGKVSDLEGKWMKEG